MTESYFVRDPFGDHQSGGGEKMNSAISQLDFASGDHGAMLRSYYNKPISDRVKELVDLSLAEGARVVTFEVGCLLQLTIENAEIAEVDLLAKAIKERCMRIYWSNVRLFLISNIDLYYHSVIPL